MEGDGSETGAETFGGPIVIVIDALSESGSPNSRDCLLHVLELMRKARSRPLPDIMRALANVEHVTLLKSTDSIPVHSPLCLM
jgi:hypothetical protein